MKYLLLIIIVLVYAVGNIVTDIQEKQDAVTSYVKTDRQKLLKQIAERNKKIAELEDTQRHNSKFIENRCVCQMWESQEDDISYTKEQLCSNKLRADLMTK